MGSRMVRCPDSAPGPLPRTVTRVRIHSPEGEPLGPCHACERTYARFGVPPEVFTTAPARDAPDGPDAPDS